MQCVGLDPETEATQADYIKLGELEIAAGPPDEALAYAYLAMQSDRLLEVVFPDDALGVVDFIRIFKGINTFGVFDTSDGCRRMVGLVWFSQEAWRGMCGVCFFGQERNRTPGLLRKRLKLLGLLIDAVFASGQIQVLYAKVPAPNTRAVMFGKLLGFEAFGPLPKYQSWHGVMCDSWMLALTRERWLARREVRS
jgi:hypothetical protein